MSRTLADIARQAEPLPTMPWPPLAPGEVVPPWGESRLPPAPCDSCAALGETRHLWIADRWEGASGPRRGLGKFCAECHPRLKALIAHKRP